MENSSEITEKKVGWLKIEMWGLTWKQSRGKGRQAARLLVIVSDASALLFQGRREAHSKMSDLEPADPVSVGMRAQKHFFVPLVVLFFQRSVGNWRGSDLWSPLDSLGKYREGSQNFFILKRYLFRLIFSVSNWRHSGVVLAWWSLLRTQPREKSVSW